VKNIEQPCTFPNGENLGQWNQPDGKCFQMSGCKLL
jgi:hypothetical protein